MKVLVIDDNPDHRFLVQRALRGTGVELTLAPDGERGIDEATRGDFDLVLLDVKMPGVDGFEVLRRLRAHLVGGPRVVMFSSSENAQDVARAMGLGADGFVTKPLDAAAFQDVVRKTVATARRSPP